MKVAVMIPAYNASAHVGNAIASLLQQRHDVNLDIIVVNDGSTDGTGEIVRRLAEQAPEVRLIETPNQGISVARNVALAAIAPDTDLATSLDADDLSPVGRFVRDVAHFNADPQLDMLYGTMIAFRGELDGLAPRADASSVRVRGVQLGLLLARVEFINSIGGFDPSLRQAEDVDYLMRATELEPKIFLSDDLSYYYRRHSGNISADGRNSRRWLALAALKSAQRRRLNPKLHRAQSIFNNGSFVPEDKKWWFADSQPGDTKR